MKYVKIQFLFSLICLMGLSFSLNAQTKADEVYDMLGYKASLPLYDQIPDLSLEQMIRIANAYRLNHDTQNAEKWYSQVADKSTEPIHKFFYAQMLQSNGNLAEAKKYFLEYDNAVGGDDSRGKVLASAIDRITEFKDTEVELKNESALNSEKLDFSPSYFNNGVVFVSTRNGAVKSVNGTDCWIDDNFMDLYLSEKDDEGGLGKAKLFSNEISTKFHEGPLTFTKNGETVYFTRNDYNFGKRGKSADGTTKLKIYSATKKAGVWGKATELGFNSSERTHQHPTISSGGDKLYFASDREGGFGGMDIWVSEFTGGKWGTPKNLGAEVNTPGNEAFPFIHDDGTLYYASDGLGGLGGYDIFQTTQDGETWTNVSNIGTPYNSNMDDFGFILNVTGTEGYLTSDREGGYGQDDIYSFIAPKGIPKKKNTTFVSTICTYDAASSARIAGSTVEIYQRMADGSLGDILDEYRIKLDPVNDNEYTLRFLKADGNMGDAETFTTNAGGQFEYPMVADKNYVFVAKKAGYSDVETEYSSEGLTEGVEYCIPMEKTNCLSLRGVITNSTYGNRLPGASITLTNKCTGDDIEVKSDISGEFYFPCLDCGCDFILKGTKKGFNTDTENISTKNEDCSTGKTLSAALEIYMGPQTRPVGTGSIPGPGPIPGYTIELTDIFYDFDQDYIREGDAQRELNQIVSLMRSHPGMTIELGSHTDTRGTDIYNRNLSQRRANQAKAYIVSKGIASSRIQAKGYGEDVPRNQCLDRVECTEEEHQYNRRTEVKVLTNDSGARVIYKRGTPDRIDPANPNRKWIWD